MTKQSSRTWQSELKSWATWAASSADDLADAGIRRLRKRFGQTGVPKIQPYMGYATKDAIRLHGRVLTNPPIDDDFCNDEWWQNLINTVQRFASDELPGINVRASANGSSGMTTSDAEGYFHIDLPREVTKGDQLFWSSARLHIANNSVVDESSLTHCRVMYTPSQAKVGIISDVDDTILHTGATDILTMAKLTFLGNARTRAPLAGVAKLYELLQHAGNRSNPATNPIFYVSSSPWNLYDLLEDFLEINAIPRGPLLLRDLGFDANKFLKGGHDHKLEKARSLMKLYDELPFVLFGDSGQEDARLYATAAEEFGDRIKAIFIRDVDPDIASEHDENVTTCMARSLAAGVPMYLVRDSDEVAKIAVKHGLLPPDAIAPIADAAKRDEQRKRSLI
jgi:phosphatidate phosphatase APP1